MCKCVELPSDKSVFVVVELYSNRTYSYKNVNRIFTLCNLTESLQASNTGNVITTHQSLQNTSIQEDHPPLDDPLLSDDMCQRCHCDKMSVTLLPCRHPTLCRGCAEDILENEKICPFCERVVTGYRVI